MLSFTINAFCVDMIMQLLPLRMKELPEYESVPEITFAERIPTIGEAPVQSRKEKRRSCIQELQRFPFEDSVVIVLSENTHL